jgi:hypothetical protein
MAWAPFPTFPKHLTEPDTYLRINSDRAEISGNDAGLAGHCDSCCIIMAITSTSKLNNRQTCSSLYIDIARYDDSEVASFRDLSARIGAQSLPKYQQGSNDWPE